MNGIQVRVARQEDCPRMMELIRELALFEKAPQEVTVTMEEFTEAGFGARPVYKAFVAEANGAVIGFALYYIRYSTWKGCRLYLEDLLITEEFRGRGVGSLLFDELIRECRRQGFNGMTWQGLDWNEPAIGFYRKYGAALDPEWLNGSLSKEQILGFEEIAGE